MTQRVEPGPPELAVSTHELITSGSQPNPGRHGHSSRGPQANAEVGWPHSEPHSGRGRHPYSLPECHLKVAGPWDAMVARPA